MTTHYQNSSPLVSSVSATGRSVKSPSLSVERSPSFFHNILDSPVPPPIPSSCDNKDNDSFYGHKDVALTTSEVLLEEFDCNTQGDDAEQIEDAFCHGLDLPHFIARCIHLGRIPYNYVWGTVLLLIRYRESFGDDWDTQVGGSTPLLGHSMFLCALYFATQEYFDPTGRSSYYQDSSMWVEMTGFSLEEDVLHRYFWDFFTNLDGNIYVDTNLDAAPKLDPDAFEPPPRRLSVKELSHSPKPPDMVY